MADAKTINCRWQNNKQINIIHIVLPPLAGTMSCRGHNIKLTNNKYRLGDVNPRVYINGQPLLDLVPTRVDLWLFLEPKIYLRGFFTSFLRLFVTIACSLLSHQNSWVCRPACLLWTFWIARLSQLPLGTICHRRFELKPCVVHWFVLKPLPVNLLRRKPRRATL
jgi:hypothetical protein